MFALLSSLVVALGLVIAQDPPVDHPAYAPLSAAEEAAIQTGASAAAAKTEADRTPADLDLIAAQQFLTRRTEAAGKAAESNAQSADAPAQLDAVRAELARLAETKDPEIAPDASLDALEALLRQNDSDLQAATQRSEEVKSVNDARAKRRQEIPVAVTTARTRLAAVETQLAAGVDADAQSPLSPERRLALRAERLALLADINALEQELAALDATKDVATARRDRAARRLELATRFHDVLAPRVEAARRERAERERLEAERLAAETALAVPEIRAIVAELEELTKKRSDPTGATAVLETERRKLAEVESDLADLRRRYRDVSDTLSRIGSGGEAGAALLREWQDAGRMGATWREVRALSERLADAELSEFNLRSRQDKLADAASEVAAIVAIHADHPQRPAIERQARELIDRRNEILNALVDEWTNLADVRGRLLATTKTLRDAAAEYREYIGGKIFGVRSVATRDAFDPNALMDAVRFVAAPSAWIESARLVARELAMRPIENGGLPLLAAVLLLLRRKTGSRFALLALGVGRYSTDSFLLTLRAAAVSVVSALPAPLALWALGSLLSSAGSGLPDQGVALGRACSSTAWVVLTIQLALAVVRKQGLAQEHFRWPADAVVGLRHHLRSFATAFVPAYVVYTLLQQHGDAAHRDGLGRIALIVQLLATAFMLGSLLRSNGPIIKAIRARSPGSVVERSAFLRIALGVGMPLALVLLDIAGYDYTAQVMTTCLLRTIAVCFAGLVVYGMLLRWLHVTRVRLAVDQARKRREQLARDAASGGAAEPPPFIDVDAVDLPAINEQSVRLFRSGTLLAMVVTLLGVWSDVLPAFHAIDRVQLWPTVLIREDEPFQPRTLLPESAQAARPPLTSNGAPTVETGGDASAAKPAATDVLPGSPPLPLSGLSNLSAITLADIARALFALVLTIVVVRNVPALLEILLIQRTGLDSGARYAAITLVRHTLTIVGTVVTFSLIGISWGQLQWLAAAFTFGIAFGLQEIFANFISGLIVLLERPMRVGDLVTVNGQTGTVARLRMRATTILDADRREVIIPNKTLITSDVINWTLSDSITRIVIPIGVAYGTDTRRAKRLLLEAALAEKYVMRDPAPQAILLGFGDSALKLELRVHLERREFWAELIDSLHESIAQAFAREHIEISFPQLDVHLRRGVNDDAAPIDRTADPNAR